MQEVLVYSSENATTSVRLGAKVGGEGNVCFGPQSNRKQRGACRRRGCACTFGLGLLSTRVRHHPDVELNGFQFPITC